MLAAEAQPEFSGQVVKADCQQARTSSNSREGGPTVVVITGTLRSSISMVSQPVSTVTAAQAPSTTKDPVS